MSDECSSTHHSSFVRLRAQLAAEASAVAAANMPTNVKLPRPTIRPPMVDPRTIPIWLVVAAKPVVAPRLSSETLVIIHIQAGRASDPAMPNEAARAPVVTSPGAVANNG